MAAVIKAANAKIRANPTLSYFCSTHFWGPASNFGIPIAAVLDTQKSPDLISPQVTAALIGYSSTFMRFAMAVQPKNYLLFACHTVNLGAQLTQGYRYLNRHKLRDAFEEAGAAAKEKVETVENKAKDAVGK